MSFAQGRGPGISPTMTVPSKVWDLLGTRRDAGAMVSAHWSAGPDP